MIKEAISKLTMNENLTYDEAKAAVDEIMSGNAEPAQVAAFLTALHIKGETIPEIAGCADEMRAKATRLNHDMDVIDIVGTGGDKSHSINISTIASFVTAAAGGHVAKHGNRAMSSKCGAADCLEALGVNLMLEPEKNEEILNKTGFCFLYAQKYHTAMKHVGPVRKSIGIPTVFNILGPLANPAMAELQLLGVYSDDMVETIAHVLNNLGIKRAMVVHGRDGLDEISVGDSTLVCEVNNGEFKTYTITPEQFGIERHEKKEIVGGSPELNAGIAKKILKGEKGAGRDAVILNAGAAIHITNEIPLEEGIKLAAEVIDSGKAYEVYEKVVQMSNE